jgi:hypothetical protein
MFQEGLSNRPEHQTGYVHVHIIQIQLRRTVNFDDTDLTNRADYLFDLLEVIPAGGGI